MHKLARVLAIAIGLSAPSLPAGATVAARTVAPASTFNAGILHVERFAKGGGRSIVLIPGLFCGSWEWNAQINALSRPYDVLAVTLPGFDGRPMITGDRLMERAAESLHLLITTHHLHRPIVAGHSLGGTIAVYFGEHYPSDATAIVTVEGGYPEAPTQAERDADVAKSVAPYEGIAQSAVGPVIKKNTLQYTITTPADGDAVEKLASRSDPSAIIAWMRAALLLDLTPGLPAITEPFTAIVPFDPVIDPYQGFKTEQEKRATYERWVGRTRDGRVIMIAPSRHFVMFDQPVKFEEAFETAISR